ncbi:MAG: fumarate reductase subunit C [Bacteroidota bacterium]
MENNSSVQSKLYTRKVPILWWMHRWVDIRFITRELTSIFVATYAVIFLFYIRSVSQGAEAFAEFSEKLSSPLLIGFHVFALAALLYHSITWFNLAPKAMVIKIGETKIPGLLIALMNYAGWIFISIVIGWLILNS